MTAEVKPLALRPNQAAAALGIGRDKIFDLISTGELKSFRLSNMRLIPVSEIEAYIQRQLEAAN